MQISDILLSHSIKPSIHRVLIYKYLIDNKNHPTVDMIYTILHSNLPTLSKTTVYNTLSLFVDKRLIQALPLEDGEMRYDADISSHVHFKCEKCQDVYDIFVETPTINLPNEFLASRSQLFVWGTCSKCHQNQD